MQLPIDHLFAFALVVVFPLRAALSGMRRLRRASPERLPEVRQAVYLEAIALQWLLVAILFTMWIVLDRPWYVLGLIPRPTPGFIGTAVGLLIIVVLVWRERRAALKSGEMLERLRTQVQHLEVMLPHARPEWHRFIVLSFTAGICEEILFRGYLLAYLTNWFGLLPAAALTAVLFGLGHLYQGARGILQTGLFGGFLVAIYVLTGSLLMPMILHTLMDLHSGHLLFRAYQREADDGAQGLAEARATAEGMAPREAGVPPASDDA